MRPRSVGAPLVASLLAVLCLSSGAPVVAQTEPGNLWDVTTSMEGAGMSMPARSQQICVPVNAEGPEAMAGEDSSDCKMTDVKKSPGRFSYRMQCPQMTGSGEMTYQGKDSYTSIVTVNTDGTTMKMTSKGKRVGSCDASAGKKQVAAAQAQVAAGKAMSCQSAVEQMLPYMLDAAAGYDCEPKYRQQLCERLRTKDGFRAVAARQPTGVAQIDTGLLPEVAKFCGVQAEQVRDKLCSDAGRTDDLVFIGEQCPVLAQPIAQRECAGRSFSTPPAEKYRDFCNAYARELMQAPGEEGVLPTKGDVVKEGARRLKGLFGR